MIKIKLNEELGSTLVDNETLRDLIENSLWADALDGAGVDNWSGYEFAQEEYEELKKDYFNDAN